MSSLADYKIPKRKKMSLHCTYQIEKSFELYDKSTGMKPIKCDITKKTAKLHVQVTWDQKGTDGESEWLNGIIRSGYRCFGADVDTMLKGH